MTVQHAALTRAAREIRSRISRFDVLLEAVADRLEAADRAKDIPSAVEQFRSVIGTYDHALREILETLSASL